MALDWSPHYSELLLAAYGRNMGGALVGRLLKRVICLLLFVGA